VDSAAFAALERYGVLGVVAALLIAAFLWYQRTQDKFRDEERTSGLTLRDEIRDLKSQVEKLSQEIRDIEGREDAWRAKYYELLEQRHPRHEEGGLDEPVTAKD
jgi:uncharacterized protein YlxW (UPF0749 family)